HDHLHGSRPDADELAAPATQIVRDRDAYLGQNRDIGRRLTDDQVELFVSDEPAAALQRELERLHPQFIALHDVGTNSSLRLLQSMATTTGKVMRLTVRRQGHGVPLATLQFVEIGGSDGTALRVYSTDVDADTHARQLIARVLVSHAKLAVLVFGDLPTHALSASMQPLVQAVSHERWPGRQMLMIPLGAPAPINGFAAPFTAAGLHVLVAPRVARATDAWSFIGSTWNQLDGVAAPPAPAAPQTPDRAHATTQPMGLQGSRAAAPAAPPHPPAPAADRSRAQPERAAPPPGNNWFDYVQRCASVKGMISCCVFDRSNGHALAHAGGRPPAEIMQALGERLLATAGDIGAMMGTGTEVTEATVSYATHHLMLRALPRQPGVVLHAVLDAATGNLALARAQLQRLDPP
ncbi:MAG: hypothetical protein RJA10_3358, partial [Pseudomonadota bacterium]